MDSDQGLIRFVLSLVGVLVLAVVGCLAANLWDRWKTRRMGSVTQGSKSKAPGSGHADRKTKSIWESSGIRAWAEKQKRESKDRSLKTREDVLNIFSEAIIWSIADFMGPAYAYGSTKDNEAGRLNKVLVQKFSGDATLFEVGCYSYAKIDYWCCQNNRNDIRELLPRIMQNFVTVCEREGGVPDVGNVFDQRIEYYGSLIRAGKFDDLYKYLVKLIYLTENNNMPRLMDHEPAPIVIHDFFVDTMLTGSVVNFQHMIMGMIRTCEKMSRMCAKLPEA